MRYCLLLLSIILTTAATAQFNFKFFGQAGGNYSTIRIPRTTGIEQAHGGYGWQIGFGTEYHTNFGYFLYLGADVRKETHSKDSLSKHHPDTVSQFNYRPLFVSFPLGIGWQFPLKNNISLKLYGGINVQVGVAGKVRRNDLFYVIDSNSQQPVLTREESNGHNLRFGRFSRKDYTYDYANSNWGIHIGTGIDFMNSFELNIFYHHGFTNILPNKDAAVEINKLSFFEVNARVYLPNDYLHEKKKKH